MAVSKDDLIKYDDSRFKVRVMDKIALSEICELACSENLITYRNNDGVETHWEVIFDKVFASDVRKWIKGQG
tara:strand:- start:354 stop:569 length:216 start_codon:yes stop_codon:yes gene_type:complete